MTSILTIAQLQEAYRCGKLSVRTFLHEQLMQAQADTHHAWISTLTAAQLDQYLDALSAYDVDELPLYGVPFAIKDNIDLAGLTTTAGCEAYRYHPENSAFVVELLIAAGAIPLGKTNLDQFATGLVGTRSPWGATTNSFNPDYISGGSSAGSAVAVATGQALFALGTDTAGSGRVPAAFNNIYGLKPTKGLLSCSGVVPACRSLDCVTFFTGHGEDLALLHQVAATYDRRDSYARPDIYPVSTAPKATFQRLRIGVPLPDQLNFFGDQAYQACFEQVQEKLTALGAELVPFDLSPFLAAARLLYQGPWVAERYAAIEEFFEQDSSRCLPVIQTIIGQAEQLSAVDTFRGLYQLQDYKVACDALLENVDVVLTPTTGTTYTIDHVNQDPVTLNSNLGYYTNFMNLLDYCAIAIPGGFTDADMPFGFTLFGPAFSDRMLMDLASQWQQRIHLPVGASGQYPSRNTHIDLLVCGAHMQGLPLNHQLTGIGATLKQRTRTASSYLLYALAGDPPKRPGLIRSETEGTAIEVEVWSVPVQAIGTLLSQIPHPLGLGSVELKGGDWVKGFICEPIGLSNAEDISHLGGWRHYLSSLSETE
ncbi:allophanate hydrolase [Vibrio mangrovi]|uniref:Allophanate hydrolase n=1 Tax=Vibrio mangrovi TaxID=474394 RepID=A0A1Y6IYH2_9VIBR|nr:allophanate hydrolase [Vibrio mangrovi]MDW6002387.1 allophanate hydrolase [Vibrio mangrovi]SMS02714.1 Allophanate hydrolase [Vibrio mangrovi]